MIENKNEFENINECFYTITKSLLEQEHIITHNKKVKEIINCSITINNVRKRIINIPERAFNMRYFIGELCFYLSGSNSLSFISHYSNFWKNCSDDGKTVNSCYGKRLLHDVNKYGITPIEYAFSELENDKHTRKAVMPIYSKHDNLTGSCDNPCTMYIQAFIRNNEFNFIVNMRSNDIWLGFTYDAAFFMFLQELMYIGLKQNTYPDLKLGKYTHNVGSMHLYENKFRIAERMELNGITPLEDYPLNNNILNEIATFVKLEKDIREGRTPCFISSFTNIVLNKYYAILKGEQYVV